MLIVPPEFAVSPRRSSMSTSSEDIDLDGLEDDLLEFHKDEMVSQALKRGVDLKKYSMELEKDLKAAETDCVGQYVTNSGEVTNLHKQIQECDAVLARMQDMLIGFQCDLSGISEEIKHLQTESVHMNVRLKNKRAIEGKLKAFVNNATIPPEMTDCITSPTVNDMFLDAVIMLNEKLNYLHSTTIPDDGSSFNILPSATAAGKQLLPDMMSLKAKSIQKAKDYFVNQILSMKKSKTNVQIIQQSSLVRYAKLYRFLQTDLPQIAEEIRSLYIETMSRIVGNVFKNYYTQLLRLDIVMASKSDLLIIEEESMKSIFTQKITFNKDKEKMAIDTFSLGDRDKVLEQIESEPILIHLAQAESLKYPYEAIMRSVLKHLVDAASNEFLFLVDFFKTNVQDSFNKIFSKALSALLENIENYLLNCHDAIGVLLLIKILRSMRMVMQRRRISVLDSFFDSISMILWPRLHAIFDLNIASLTSASLKKLGQIDLAPQYVSKRYADFVSSIFLLRMIEGASDVNTSRQNSNNSLNSMNSSSGRGNTDTKQIQNKSGSEFDADKDRTILNNVQSLRTNLIDLLGRLAVGTFMSNKDQRVFFINNYDRILRAFEENKVNNQEVREFENLLVAQRELFAEEEVKTAFPRLISFVTQTEQLMNANAEGEQGQDQGGAGSQAQGPVSLDEAIVESLVREFSSSWRNGIQQINDDVLAYFANFRNGMEILKQVLTQLLLYYTRFQDIVKKSFTTKAPAFTRDIVSTAAIMMEIKKYSRTF